MKVYTSYFYQIRFFKPYQIPFSTAMWNPAWYKPDYVDHHGVMNGLRVPPLIPNKRCVNQCIGREKCKLQPRYCNFLKYYKQQLDGLDFYKVMDKCADIAYQVKEDLGFEEEPEIIFIVYETPDNPCSERGPIQQWLREHGISVTEWSKEM